MNSRIRKRTGNLVPCPASRHIFFNLALPYTAQHVSVGGGGDATRRSTPYTLQQIAHFSPNDLANPPLHGVPSFFHIRLVS